METIDSYPQTQELRNAVEAFTDGIQQLTANRYGDEEASNTLLPLCRAVVEVIMVAADDDELLDLLTTVGEGTIDRTTACVIVEYSRRMEDHRATGPVDREQISEPGSERQRLRERVIRAEQAGIVDRLIRVRTRVQGA